MLLFDSILYELLLFAATGFMLLGINEAIIDALWILRSIWRQLFVFSIHNKMSVASLPKPALPGTIAVLVAAWDESAVIGQMLRHLTNQFAGRDYHVIVGCYPNDPATIAEIAAIGSPQISIALNPLSGPTTKAQCLNVAWSGLVAIEKRLGKQFKAIVLHDAEDVVHKDEIAIYDYMIERFALVQLPVYPMIDRNSRWIGGHYGDEFAESHGKALVVREAIGAAVPAAGVGCAIDRVIIGRVAKERGGDPFDPDSLTEDYELGLRIKALGGSTAIVRLREAPGKPIVAIRAHFPGTLETAVRQKTRWMIGIALAGWDRLGWQPDVVENWMRLRDRIAPLAAIILLAGYACIGLLAIRQILASVWQYQGTLITAPLGMILAVNAVLLFWRLVVRAAFVTHDYGLKEGMRSIPRVIIANVIAMMAARRAVAEYLNMQRSNTIRWDKTEHIFPEIDHRT